ncbi:MAG: hypothetical protein LGB07_05800 [Sulfurovum sp.]|nr:hypothetical protein [Sulfurovum sp.]MCB4749988.1 hypothetical protein [Sulfurovum sp.]MCB4751762.1 hypothetical protein [Sulfurovum sp.]MCB4754091.1 hypothetical protein [Sulfurovum sp.]MCB4758012.1 hypothetical protein [Sulfurovum sp.]
MIAEIVVSHSILIKVFLGFLVVGFFIPFVIKKNSAGFKKASFIYTMIFQAIVTMIAFTGILLFVMGNFDISLSVIMMTIIWVLLMFVEIKKYKLIKMTNIDNEEIHILLKSAFLKVSSVQVILVIAMVALKIMEVKGVVSLS